MAREWPNKAADSRDRAAEEAVAALRELRPMLRQRFTSEEQVRRVAAAIDSLQLIARILESEGASTRP